MNKTLLGLAALAVAWLSPQGEPRLGRPIPGITVDQQAAFREGSRLFSRTWVPDGEGAYFNAGSCAACHFEPSLGGASANQFRQAFFVPDPTDPSGMKPFPWLIQRIGRPSGQRLPGDDFESRRPQPLYGLGLIEAVPIEQLRALADPTDKNKDGISGRILETSSGPGRFGWKGNIVSIDAFVEDAFRFELGLPKGRGENNNELTAERLKAVADYVRFLGAPQPKPPTDAATRGKEVFANIGCVACHVPTLTTKSPIPQLDNQTIALYSDLLVHDLGRGKAELKSTGPATRKEYRTAPLWGLGRMGEAYFHDGSSGTIEEAIERHEGEAMKSRDAWKKLPVAQRADLQAFLKNL